ncbi:MAG: hypothetical protein VZS44_02240 [Bacilli bacterium]|nr:hypothetical protein [Bacilli bacterium]
MNIRNSNNKSIGWLIATFIVPIFITIIMLLQWDEKSATVMGIIIAIIWVIAIAIAISIIKDDKKEKKEDPYPFKYVVDYDTLINYMKKEDEFSTINKLEASFHFYLYLNKEKNEIQSWHFTESNDTKEQAKGITYYWNKEEYATIDKLIEQKLKNINYPILIELIDSDNELLNNYKKNHPEIDIAKYIENNYK